MGCLSRELPGEHRPRERWSVMSYGRRRGLRPVSPYAIVLALAIALTASFFLPLRAEAAISDHTVPTISPSGTTINLFDYWVNPDDHLSVSGNGGINANHRFQFKDQGASEELNQYTGDSRVRTGIVNNVLAGGYPKLTGRWEGESLGYLFDSSVQTGKISHMGVTGLLRAKGGYYEYDSSQNYAAYNANKNAFDVYNAAGVMQAGAEPHSVGQFFPFDAADEVFKEEGGKLVPNGITSQNNGPLNHYFGLSMSSRFVQPKDGKTNADKPMTFEFAGDDDVWVFIDDVLVGDIGGIHASAKLTIDFQTGKIKVNDSPDGTLLSKFQEAKQDTTKGFKGDTFDDGTNHTLKFFYLERGATDSNMKLKFNLVTVPESDIIKFDQDGGLVEGAQFALYKTDERFADTTTNPENLLGSGTTNANGQLTLTNDVDNGVINFDDLYKEHGYQYYLLKETKAPNGYRSSLTATDGSMQLEYVPASDKNDAGGVIINRGGMDAGSVVWKTGAFAAAKETITAPPTVYKANNDLAKSNETVSLDSGILFAVVLKRDKSANADIKDQNNWYAVSGDPSTGMGYTLAGKPSKAGAIEAAKKDLHAFTLNTSGQYQVEIQNLPGDISKYYYLLSGNDRKNAEYTVAIYYTAASSIAEADMDNTVHVFSDDLPDGKENFRRQFATRLLVSNIQNRLFVQKTDTAGKPVEGAKFGLYTADQVTTDANGKVTLPVKTSSGGGSSSGGSSGGGGYSISTINVKVTDKDGKAVTVSKSTGTDKITLTLPTGKDLSKDDNYYTITVTDRNGKAKTDYTVVLKDKNSNELTGKTDDEGILILPAKEHKAYIVGYNDGTFRPEDNVTRAEFVTMAVRYYEIFNEVKKIGYTVKYTDVSSNYWAYTDIAFAKNIGWLNGYADGTFKGDNNITRAEVVTVTNHATGRIPDQECITKNVTTLNRFTDLKNNSHWAYNDIMEAANTHKAVTSADNETWVK